jgi:ankyrin repeat protein
MAKRVMEACPGLARQENEDKCTPMHVAVIENKIDVFTVLLQYDPSLGYLISSSDGSPLLSTAASQGNVGVARELLRHCSDPPYCDATGSTCLHIAVSFGQADFVRFVVRSPQLQHLINLPNDRGETALQLAARNNNTDMVDTLQINLNNLIIHAEYFTSVRMVYLYISCQSDKTCQFV